MQTATGSQHSPSSVPPPCLVLDNTFAQTTPFHFLCLANSYHSFFMETNLGISFWHQTGLLASTSPPTWLRSSISITYNISVWFTYLAPPSQTMILLEHFCILFPLLGPSIHPSLFDHLENSSASNKYVTSFKKRSQIFQSM